MRPHPFPPFLLILAGLVLGGGVAIDRRVAEAEAPATRSAEPSREGPSAGGPARVSVAASQGPEGIVASPRPLEGAASGRAVFDDGSARPALNGATGDLVMPWPGGGRFSPIVEVVVHEGTSWWRHADGSMSTTLVRRDQVSGRDVQLPVCCRPEPVLAKSIPPATRR